MRRGSCSKTRAWSTPRRGRFRSRNKNRLRKRWREGTVTTALWVRRQESGESAEEAPRSQESLEFTLNAAGTHSVSLRPDLPWKHESG